MKWLTNRRESFKQWDGLPTAVKGPPKATRWHTVEELEAMGLYGMYDPDAKDEEEAA